MGLIRAVRAPSAWSLAFAFATLLGALSRPILAQDRIHAALLAQATGPGGCTQLDTVTSASTGFFPGVVFHVARCVAEHGTAIYPVVATDSTGTIFTLNAAEDLRFLQMMHPPQALSSETVPRYAAIAYRLSGRCLSRSTITDSTMVGSTVEDRPHYWMVRVSGCAEDTTAAVLVVHKGGGEVVRIQ